MFGIDEFGFTYFPPKISNIKIARFVDDMGCPYCFPHGYETINATIRKNTHNWKNHRKTKWRIKK